MTVAPLPRRTDRLTTEPSRPRPKLPTGKRAGRRRRVTLTKLMLPVFAVVLLASLVLWPQIAAQINNARISYRRGGLSGEFQAGKLRDVRYRGMDARGRPYTITSDAAVQDGPERLNLVNPKGDIQNENGSWTLVESKDGVYIQHAGLLDLSGDVVVYRDDGITVRTQSAAMDLKAGAAAGNQATHVEGPFGTLDAQGFALVDKGAVVQFQGKSRLLLNGSHR